MAFPGFEGHGGRPSPGRWLAGWMVALILAAPIGAALPRHLTWDVASDTGYQAGSGVWNSDTHWSSDGKDQNLWPGAGYVAVFSGITAASAITVNGSVSADSIVFTASGYTLAGGTIAMTGSKPVVVVDADAVLQSAMSGAWTKSGTRKLHLSGTNTGTTSFTHAEGTTFVEGNPVFGTGPVVVDGPGRLILASGIEIANRAVLTTCSPGTGTGVLSPDSGVSATWTGALDVNADCSNGGALSGANTAGSQLMVAGPIRMGGTATRVRQQDGTVVYKGGGTASAFELAKGTARLGGKDGLPPTAAWSQSAATDTSTLDMNGFDQSFPILHSPANPAAKIVNTKDWNVTLRLTGSVDSTYGGTIAGNIALELSGTGRQFLSGTNTYVGPTNVKSGTLCVTGSLSALSTVAVDSGATLCGTGTAAGSIAVAGGTVAPGLPGGIGLLNGGSLAFSSSKASKLRIRVAGTNKPGIEYDRLALAGSLVLGGGSILELDLSGLTQAGTATGIATAASVSGLFDSVVVRNAPKGCSTQLEYKSGLVNVVVAITGTTPPSFAKGPSQTSLEDAGARSVPNWATSISAGSGQTPAFRVSTDRPNLFASGPAVSSSGILTWTSVADSNGTAIVRVRLGASGNPDSSAIDSFTIQVAAVNDPPRFTKGPDQIVGAGSGVKNLAKWATSISPGPPDESGQKLSFRMATRKSSLYAEPPSLSADGTLRFAPSATSMGVDTLFVRLGDDGGSGNGGFDSSRIDTFTISIRPLVFAIRPDTLKLRPGATGRFSAIAKASNGTDSAIAENLLSWSWSVVLGTLDTGRVAATRAGTSRIVAQGFGLADTAWLVVADTTAVPGPTDSAKSKLDTLLARSTDSVTLDAGHGVAVTVPPHTAVVHVSIRVVDSALVGVGIAGADSAIVVRSDAPDSLLVKAPYTLVSSKLRAALGNPSVFLKDSSGTIHLVASAAATVSSTAFRASGTQAYWLGYDTAAPVVTAVPGSDSISTKPVKLDWSLRDNVAETGIWLCLLEAGRTVPRCSLLTRSDSARGSASVGKSSLPLGGMVWVEGRDSRDTAISAKRDMVVRLDTIKAPWTRMEDRYEMLALPYVAGSGSAHQAFFALWGEEDDRKWRAFGADSGAFVEILSGERMDAQGRGFWVRTRGADLATWSIGHWTTPMSKPVVIHLEPGWNAVGNPLGFDVPWSKVLALSGLDSSAIIGPYSFDPLAQGWTIPDTTRVWPAWRGVALFLSGKKAVDLLVPSLAADAVGGRILSPMSAARAASSPAGFRLSTTVAQGSDTAPKVWIGIDGAGRSFPMPPLPSSGIRAVLIEPGRGTLPFLSVARAVEDTNSTWTLRVSKLAPGIPVTLDLWRQDRDTTRKVWIRDDKSGRWLAANGRLEIAMGSETERTFALRVGPAPGAGRLARVFGFENRGQLVAWSLPDEMGRVQVRIDAFDLRGCLLEHLVDEDLDPGSYARPLEVRSPIHQYLLVLRAGGRRESILRYWTR